MKITIAEIAGPIASIVNCSYSSGSFPDQLKVTKVCPIFKSGQKSIFSNYRPISVLPSFSKSFENVLYKRLNKYLVLKNIISTSQYGFRPNHSTFMPLLDMYSDISRSIVSSDFSIGVCIALWKAFVTINHDILFRKFEHYGIRGVPLK